MPIGCVSCVPDVVAEIAACSGGKILDAGIGFGLYGAAVRQWLDNGVKPFRTYLMGIEAFERYRSPCWDLYDWIHESPIQAYLAADNTQGDRFEAVLLLDVLEHFEKPEGVEVVTGLKSRLANGGKLIVATPGVWIEQGDAYGNEFERHRSLWTGDDLAALGFRILSDGSPDRFGNRMVVGVFTNSPESPAQPDDAQAAADEAVEVEPPAVPMKGRRK